ncbi:B12-binding domain-containing radical SAM protein [bacterium]|nr:B12-binding domain-containing radical SAM protein [candidate division CSSED10-310 bacterium]
MAFILLVNPRIGIYTRVFKPFIPLSLLAAASLADRAGHRIRVLDQHVDKNWESTLKQILVRDRPVLAGITSMTGAQLKGALRAARIIRETSGVPIVWGGVHASLFPEGTLRHPDVDFITVGEGELALLKLTEALDGKGSFTGIPNLGYIADGKTVINLRGPFWDLDDLPDTPYNLVDVRPYLHTYFWEKQVIDMESSRGCPFSCGFCYNETYNQRQWRARSPERMVGAIRNLVQAHGITNFLFIDDSFFIDSDRVAEFVDRLAKESYRIKMGFQGRINSVSRLSEEVFGRLVHAGAVFFQFGVESGSPRILDLINKKLTVEQALGINRRMSRYPGVSVFYNFMVGLPTETEAEVFQTVDLAWRLLKENPRAYLGTIHLYKEYPGTPLYERALSEGYQPPETLEEWADYDWQSVVERSGNPKLTHLCRAVSAASYCVDRKIEMLGDSKLASVVSDIYRPIARFRFKHKFFRLMPEARIF